MEVTDMVDKVGDNLTRANQVLAELKEAGYSNKDLQELSLLVLLELGCNVENPRVDGHSI